MRAQSAADGVVDLYLVVNDYKEVYQKRRYSFLNSLLPPNVYYLEVNYQGRTLRVKYSIISMENLKQATENWFHSYIWSRFAQPFRLLYARDESCCRDIYQIRARAVLKFLSTTIPAINSETMDAEDIWINGLTLAYAAEFRMENKSSRAMHIVHENLGDYIRLTASAAPGLSGLIRVLPHGYYERLTDDRLRRKTLVLWKLRRWQGHVLSVLRLVKATFTFKDCIKYAVWKIHRHTGINIDITPRMQRYPILSGFNILWQLIRRGALH